MKFLDNDIFRTGVIVVVLFLSIPFVMPNRTEEIEKLVDDPEYSEALPVVKNPLVKFYDRVSGFYGFNKLGRKGGGLDKLDGLVAKSGEMPFVEGEDSSFSPGTKNSKKSFSGDSTPSGKAAAPGTIVFDYGGKAGSSKNSSGLPMKGSPIGKAGIDAKKVTVGDKSYEVLTDPYGKKYALTERGPVLLERLEAAQPARGGSSKGVAAGKPGGVTIEQEMYASRGTSGSTAGRRSVKYSGNSGGSSGSFEGGGKSGRGGSSGDLNLGGAYSKAKNKSSGSGGTRGSSSSSSRRSASGSSSGAAAAGATASGATSGGHSHMTPAYVAQNYSSAMSYVPDVVSVAPAAPTAETKQAVTNTSTGTPTPTASVSLVSIFPPAGGVLPILDVEEVSASKTSTSLQEASFSEDAPSSENLNITQTTEVSSTTVSESLAAETLVNAQSNTSQADIRVVLPKGRAAMEEAYGAITTSMPASRERREAMTKSLLGDGAKFTAETEPYFSPTEKKMTTEISNPWMLPSAIDDRPGYSFFNQNRVAFEGNVASSSKAPKVEDWFEADEIYDGSRKKIAQDMKIVGNVDYVFVDGNYEGKVRAMLPTTYYDNYAKNLLGETARGVMPGNNWGEVDLDGQLEMNPDTIVFVPEESAKKTLNDKNYNNVIIFENNVITPETIKQSSVDAAQVVSNMRKASEEARLNEKSQELSIAAKEVQADVNSGD